MSDFFKIWNMGFCYTIIDNFHAKNKNDPPYRFWAAHPAQMDAHTDEVNLITLRNCLFKIAGGLNSRTRSPENRDDLYTDFQRPTKFYDFLCVSS